MNSSKSETEATLKTLGSYGVKAAAFQANLTTEASVEKWFSSHVPLTVWAAADITPDRLFSDAAAALGVSKFDIAINTVGKVLKKPIVETTEQGFDDMFLVNSKCAFFFIKHAAKNLNEGGTIISLVTSLLGAFAPGYSTYQGSKAPVEWFTKSDLYIIGFSLRILGSTVWLRGQWTLPSFTGKRLKMPLLSIKARRSQDGSQILKILHHWWSSFARISGLPDKSSSQMEVTRLADHQIRWRKT